MEKKKLRKLAKDLGARVITDPKERIEFEKKYGLSHPFFPRINKLDSVLAIHCQKHPKYRATRKPKTKCVTCHLLYILCWQHSEEGPGRLGGLNSYQFSISGYQELEDALMGLEVFKK